MDRQGPPNRPRYQLTRGLTGLDNEKDAVTSFCLDRSMHEATPGECTLCDRSCQYFIQNDFFCRLAGPVAPTGKAIVHWIGY